LCEGRSGSGERKRDHPRQDRGLPEDSHGAPPSTRSCGESTAAIPPVMYS
jgi:hypothetical protein